MNLSQISRIYPARQKIFSALLTPNVFQNCHSALRNDYAEISMLLRQILASDGINFYMTDYDKALVDIFVNHFGLYRNQDIYRFLIDRVKSIKTDCESIKDEAKLYCTLNSIDAVRMASAIDRQLDAVITWEPHHFVIGDAAYRKLQERQYFDFELYSPSDQVECEELSVITVYSVRSFWNFINDSGISPGHREIADYLFSVDDISIFCDLDSNGNCQYEATVSLRHSTYGRCESKATSQLNDFDAIRVAVNNIVDMHFDLPERIIIRYISRNTTSRGYIQRVHRVEMTGSCGDLERSFISSEVNLHTAMANCYCQLVNLAIQEYLEQG